MTLLITPLFLFLTQQTPAKQNALQTLQQTHSSSRTFTRSSEKKYQNEKMFRAGFEFAFPQ